MPSPRRILATVFAAALVGVAATAAPASAATIAVTLPCVIYGGSYADPAIPIAGSGFAPNGAVSLTTTSAGQPTPASLATAQANAGGAFAGTTGAAVFKSSSTQKETFTLTASDGVNVATTSFIQVRAGYYRKPDPDKPGQKVKHIAQGFPIGKTIWAHFRHHSKTYANKKLGVAQAPCGTATRKMKALPTKSRLGKWKVFVDQSKQYHASTRPQARLTFTVFRKFL